MSKMPAAETAPTMAQRLLQVEDHTRLVLAHRTRMAGPPQPDPDDPSPRVVLVPVPRRARMFVLRGQAQGFVDVTLTSPPRTA